MKDARSRAQQVLDTIIKYPDRRSQELHVALALQTAWMDGRLAGTQAADERVKGLLNRAHHSST